MMNIMYRTADVDGFEIFYREVGSRTNPTLLLLHGYPSSGHQFRDLIPLLQHKFHLVAPDLPGFGRSAFPSRSEFTYSFENLATAMSRFTDVIGLKTFGIYVFDYGAPTGFRMALAQPERITSVISQNGNVYEEGLSEGWAPIQRYWKEQTQAHRDALREFLTPEAIRLQYTHGVPDQSIVSYDGSALDTWYMGRPDAHEVQLDLFLDYASNVALYPKFQEFLRKHQPMVLAAWGKNDPFFLSRGAEAFRRDVPDARVKFYDTGHFALETHASDIAMDIIALYDR